MGNNSWNPSCRSWLVLCPVGGSCLIRTAGDRKEGSLFLTTSLQPPLGPTGSLWERVVGGESLPPYPADTEGHGGTVLQLFGTFYFLCAVPPPPVRCSSSSG